MADQQYIITIRRPATCAWCQTTIPAGPAYDAGAAKLHPECMDAWDRDPCGTEAGQHLSHMRLERGHTCVE